MRPVSSFGSLSSAISRCHPATQREGKGVVTVAVNVTDCPNTDGLSDDVTTVVVLAL